MTVAAAVAPRPHGLEQEVHPDRHRETIVRRLSDLLFLSAGQISPFEKGLVDEILSGLYGSLDSLMRLRLARRLAPLSEPPPRLTRLMAVDKVEIAHLFLERQELFDEAELAQLIARTGPEHHLLLARRPSLSAAATEALLGSESPEIVEILLGNPGAVFSFRGYEKLVELSRGNVLYQELLLSRSDLPAQLAHEMFWWVGARLRRGILQRFSMERRLLVEAIDDLKHAHGQASADIDWAFRLSGAVRPRAGAGDLAALADWLRAPAERRHCETLAAALAIDGATVERIGLDSGGEPLVVFLKALGLSVSQYKALGPHIALGLAEPEEPRLGQLSALFESLSTDWADLVLRLWDEQQVKAVAAFPS
jgi:Uncharacterised protein conserved in bacteria (DUF2336)